MFKLNQQFERFYTRHAYTPIRDCWERPICSLPGARIDVMDRVSSDGNWTYTLVLQHTLGCVEVFSCMAPHHCSPPPPPSMPGTKRNCLNLGSYNYLGFAENSGPCTEAVKETMKCCGVACCSARGDYGEGRGGRGHSTGTDYSLCSARVRQSSHCPRVGVCHCSVCWQAGCHCVWDGLCHQLHQHEGTRQQSETVIGVN